MTKAFFDTAEEKPYCSEWSMRLLLLPNPCILGMAESHLPGYLFANEGYGEAWTLELERPRLNPDSTT